MSYTAVLMKPDGSPRKAHRRRLPPLLAYPDKASLETMEKIESEVANLRKIGANLFVSMGDHPTLGSVLFLSQDDGGGFVWVDRVTFR